MGSDPLRAAPVRIETSRQGVWPHGVPFWPESWTRAVIPHGPPSDSRWSGPRGCHPAKVSSLLVPVLRAVCFAATLPARRLVAFGLMVLLAAATPALAQAPPEGGIVKG